MSCQMPPSIGLCHLLSTIRKVQALSAMPRSMSGSLQGNPANNNRRMTIVAEPAQLQSKIDSIRHGGGFSKLQVIADFDMTLTKYMVNGRRGQSSHSLIKQNNPEYDLKRQQLFDHYHPLEISPDIPVFEKSKLMEEWWEKTHSLLIEGGLTQEAIVRSVVDAVIEFRDGVDELFQILQENSVPVLIFSAGLADIIEEVMHQKLQQKYSNVRIVSNRMVFNLDGTLQGFKGKTIHVLNKNEHALGLSNQASCGVETVVVEDINLFDLRARKNVLLLGDHIGDLGMSDGLDYVNRISVGFLNGYVDGWLDEYKRNFDVVLVNDETVKYAIHLVQQLALP